MAKSPRKKDDPPADQKPPADRQVNFRANAKLYARLDDVADALGVDVSNLVRMILNENIARYEQRVQRIRQGLPAEDISSD